MNKNKNIAQNELLICECHSHEHQIIFTYFDDNEDKEVFMTIHLAKRRSFWQRFKYAFKYLFGYQCRYGAFEEMIINKDDATKLDKLSEYLKK